MKKNDELFEVTIKTANIMISMGEDKYQECKYTLLAKVSDNPNLQNYLNAVFNFVENRRPLQLEQKKSTN